MTCNSSRSGPSLASSITNRVRNIVLMLFEGFWTSQVLVLTLRYLYDNTKVCLIWFLAARNLKFRNSFTSCGSWDEFELEASFSWSTGCCSGWSQVSHRYGFRYVKNLNKCEYKFENKTWRNKHSDLFSAFSCSPLHRSLNFRRSEWINSSYFVIIIMQPARRYCKSGATVVYRPMIPSFCGCS